jgi:hypothetical protein
MNIAACRIISILYMMKNTRLQNRNEIDTRMADGAAPYGAAI